MQDSTHRVVPIFVALGSLSLGVVVYFLRTTSDLAFLQNLPSFFHAFAFTVLLAGFRDRRALPVLASFLVCGFEFLQNDALRTLSLPGTFDPKDLVFAGTGVLLGHVLPVGSETRTGTSNPQLRHFICVLCAVTAVASTGSTQPRTQPTALAEHSSHQGIVMSLLCIPKVGLAIPFPSTWEVFSQSRERLEDGTMYLTAAVGPPGTFDRESGYFFAGAQIVVQLPAGGQLFTGDADVWLDTVLGDYEKYDDLRIDPSITERGHEIVLGANGRLRALSYRPRKGLHRLAGDREATILVTRIEPSYAFWLELYDQVDQGVLLGSHSGGREQRNLYVGQTVQARIFTSLQFDNFGFMEQRGWEGRETLEIATRVFSVAR